MQTFVEIHLAGLAPQQHELPRERVVVGSATDATIRIPAHAGFAAYQLELTPGDDGVDVKVAAGIATPIVFRGVGCNEALVPWGEEVYVAGARLGFVKRARRTRGAALLLLAPALVLAAGLALVPNLEQSANRDDVEAPTVAPMTSACRETEPARAHERARETERAGFAKLQRFEFVAHEGVEALDLLNESSACYGVAQHGADRERLQAALTSATARVNADYTAARLKLRLALDQGRSRDALSAVSYLRSLLAGRPSSPYMDWLCDVERRLQRKLSGS